MAGIFQCLIPPRTTHSVGVFDDSIIINIIVKTSTFQSTFFQLFSGNNALAHFFTHVLYKKTEGNYLIFHAGNDELIRSMIEDLYIEDIGHEKYSGPILNNMLMLFWGQLLRRHEDHIESFLNVEHGSLQITEVLSLICRKIWLLLHCRKPQITSVSVCLTSAGF